MKIRTASGLKTVARFSVRKGGALRQAGTISMRKAGVLREFASVGGMTVTASPTEAYGYGNSHGPIIISTTGVLVSVVGGTAPYTFSWVADLGQMEAISPSSAATAFRTTAGVGPGDSTNDDFTCTVTDANSNIAVSNVVSASASNFGT